MVPYTNEEHEYREIKIKYLDKLIEMGCKNIVFTGIAYNETTTGVLVCENGRRSYYEHQKLPNSCHGTGDIYSSAFVGALMRDKKAYEAARI